MSRYHWISGYTVIFTLALLLVNCNIINGQAVRYSISSIAGNGTNIGSPIGDGSLAIYAILNEPCDVAISNGKIFIVESNRIRLVTANGYISTIVGNGTDGYNGDGIVASTAMLNTTKSVAIGPTTGDIYIADSGSNRIRRIVNGFIETVAGTGFGSFSSDWINATKADLNYPTGVAVGTNNEIYIAEWKANRIRKVFTNGTIVTIAGNGTAGFSGDNGMAIDALLNGPYGITVSSNNEVYFSDYFNHRIRKISTLGIISTIAGNGSEGFSADDGVLAINTQMSYPQGISIQSNGEIYYSDVYRVRKVFSNGTVITIVASLSLNVSNGISIDSTTGSLYIAEKSSNKIRIVSSDGSLSTFAGTSNFVNNIPALEAQMYPTGPIFVNNSQLVFADKIGQFRQLDLNTNLVSTLAGNVGGNIFISEFPNPLAVNYFNNYMYILYSSSKIATIFSNLVQAKFSSTGSIMSFKITSSGDIYYSDYAFHIVRMMFANGTFTTIAGISGNQGYNGDGILAKSATLNCPYDVAISETGEVLIADQNNHRIRKVFTNGTITTIAGNGEATSSGDGGLAVTSSLFYPIGVSISLSGEIFISEKYRIRKILTNGTIFTVAGADNAGYNGDYALATRSQLNTPNAVSFGSSGEIYFADSANSIIRRLTPICNSVNDCDLTSTFSILGIPSYYTFNSDITQFTIVISKIKVNQTIIDYLMVGSGNTISGSFFNSKIKDITLSNTENGILTLTPPASVSSQFIVNYATLKTGLAIGVKFTISIGNTGSTLVSDFNLIFKLSPKAPLGNLLTLNSTRISAINESLQLSISPWTAESDLYPLKYAISMTTSKLVSIRMTEFSENLNRSIVLPYLKENITLGIIVMDSLGNTYTNTSSISILVSPFIGTEIEYSRIASSSLLNFNQIQAFIYDSFSGSTSYYSKLLSNVDMSTSDTTGALSSVSQIISKVGELDETIANSTISKLSELISYSYTRYNTSKSNYGYVNSKLSNENVNSILSYASQFLGEELLISNSRELSQNLANLIILGQSITYFQNDNSSLSSTSFSSSNINMTISAFSISTQQINQKISQNQTSVSFDASYIISQNNAYSSECAVSLITFSNIFNSSFTTNDSISSESISITTDFKFFKNQKVVNLQNLATPIIIEFKLQENDLVLLEKLENSTVYNLTCAYLEESNGIWSDKGCFLYSYNIQSGLVQCACNHTTLFTTFLEQKSIALSEETKLQVASLYYGQISLGIFYFILSITIIILMLVFRKSQPLVSRLSTPYLGMIALTIESALIYIIQRSVLVDQLFKDSTVWSSGDLASNWIANIVMIFVNTLNLTAILAYLIQVLRFQLMKYLYNILQQVRKSQSQNSQEKLLKTLKTFTSNKFLNGLLIGFAIVNVIYWTLWVILRRCGVIPITAYTYIISISYIVVIFVLSALITSISVGDFIISMIRQHAINKKIATDETKDDSKKKVDLEMVEKKIASMGIHKWLISMDSPLYFRGEMLLYIVFFILLIVNQSLGLSTLPFRYENEDSYRNVLTNDVIAFIFEVLYVAVYILVFGGYSLLILLSNKIRFKLRKTLTLQQDSNEDENREMTQLIENPFGRDLFEEFCKKEFSTENLYLFLDLQENEQLITTNGKEFNNFLSRIFNNYIKRGSEMEVNIPSSCSKQFIKLLSNNENQQETEMVDLKNNPSRDQVDECFKDLKDNILMNLSDTFSRFVLTSEYDFFSQVFDYSQNNLGKSLNI